MTDERKIKKGINAWHATGFVWEVLIAVALPVTLSAFLGRWLDRRFHTGSVFTLMSFIPALAIAFLLILRLACAFQKNLKDQEKNT